MCVTLAIYNVYKHKHTTTKEPAIMSQLGLSIHGLNVNMLTGFTAGVIITKWYLVTFALWLLNTKAFERGVT